MTPEMTPEEVAKSCEMDVCQWEHCMFFRSNMCCGREYIEEGKCSVCGRKLTNLESVEKGIGPECEKKRVSFDKEEWEVIDNDS